MEPQWERLGEYVRQRRKSKGWSQQEVADRGGPSDTLQTEIETQRWKPTRSVRATLNKIDIGMEWAHGSASDILSGGEPREDTDEVGAGMILTDSMRESAATLAHLFSLVWESWRDLTIELVHRPDAEMARKARWALLTTADIAMDILTLAGDEGDDPSINELVHDIQSTCAALFDLRSPAASQGVKSSLPDDAEVGPTAAEVDAAAGVSELKNDSGIHNAEQG